MHESFWLVLLIESYDSIKRIKNSFFFNFFGVPMHALSPYHCRNSGKLKSTQPKKRHTLEIIKRNKFVPVITCQNVIFLLNILRRWKLIGSWVICMNHSLQICHKWNASAIIGLNFVYHEKFDWKKYIHRREKKISSLKACSP